MKNYSFTTTDLALAAALCVTYELEAINNDDPRRVVFIFGVNAEIDKMAEDFWNKHLTVDALTYWSALKTLKSRIYE